MVHSGAGLALAIGALAGGAETALAQSSPAPEAQLVWNLEGTESGWCLQFLIDPTKAGDDLPDGAVPVPASEAGELHPAIQRLISDEPQYARWVPSQVCTWFFNSVTAAGHRVDRNKKSPPAIAWWGVLTHPKAGSDSEPVFALRMLATNNWRIQKPSEAARVSMRSLDVFVEKVPETQEDRYTLRYGKTTVMFDGHASPDTMTTPETISQVWWTEGDASTVWRGAASLHPSSTHALVGALTIQGKGDLADALKASPIRLVGPVHSGGDGEVSFFHW
jgi:hypothetical protein